MFSICLNGMLELGSSEKKNSLFFFFFLIRSDQRE
jgi:hypothetical protein